MYIYICTLCILCVCGVVCVCVKLACICDRIYSFCMDNEYARDVQIINVVIVMIIVIVILVVIITVIIIIITTVSPKMLAVRPVSSVHHYAGQQLTHYNALSSKLRLFTRGATFRLRGCKCMLVIFMFP